MRSLVRTRLAGIAAIALAATMPAATTAQLSPTAKISAEVKQPRRPNVILILADDVGVEAFRSYGGEYATPNISRLAAEGVTFDNAFSTPLCSPSRTRIMTARENAKNYAAFGYLDPKERTFGNLFRDAGYATGIVGKWQLSGNGFDGRVGITPQGAGFDESLLWQLQAGTQKGSRYWGPTLWRNGRPIIAEEGFGPDDMSDFALSFIDKNKDRPFFLYYPMVLVHDPFVPTPDSLQANGAKPRFGGMMTYMDKLVGQLTDKLRALGLDDDTLIVFTADNGTNRQITSIRNGAEVTGGKGAPSLTGTHVPLILRWPGRIAAGSRRTGLFDFLDVLPTMAEAATLPVPGGIDGVSQWRVATGKAQRARETIFQHYAPLWVFAPARFVFDDGRKLYGDGRYVALDFARDVETEIASAEMTGTERRHRDRLQALLDKQGDGPLDPIRFPWCKGKPPAAAGGDPVMVGCGMSPREVE
jgi:arylsulfatase A-like enzyme